MILQASSRVRLLGAFFAAFLVGLLCCSSESSPGSGSDAGSDAGLGDAALDAKKDAESVKDAADEGGGPGSACTFNRDCSSTTRCACVDGDCKCEVGPRGKGKSGVDLCKDGNDCESSLCLEGTGDVLTCSGECVVPGDCGPKLPVCSNIAIIGTICVRDKP